jgi:hypothetical protein
MFLCFEKSLKKALEAKARKLKEKRVFGLKADRPP